MADVPWHWRLVLVAADGRRRADSMECRFFIEVPPSSCDESPFASHHCLPIPTCVTKQRTQQAIHSALRLHEGRRLAQVCEPFRSATLPCPAREEGQVENL